MYHLHIFRLVWRLYVFFTNPLSMRTFVQYMYSIVHYIVQYIYMHAEHINCI
jgi:hypothetical protein